MPRTKLTKVLELCHTGIVHSKSIVIRTLTIFQGKLNRAVGCGNAKGIDEVD